MKILTYLCTNRNNLKDYDKIDVKESVQENELLYDAVLNDDVAHVRCGERRFKTSLVIAADGVDSPVRALAGFTGQGAAYAQEAVVAHLAPHEPHGAVARQRFLKTGPLALLPLADGRVSLVWSTTPIEAERLLAMTPAEFGAAVSEASDSTLGALTLASERARFALRHFQADRYMATRCVLVGDAAHSVHPLAGQGVNLGLLDVEALCRHIETALSRGADIGDARGLDRGDLARLVEVAALDQKLKSMGHDTAREFNERLLRAMKP
jgi:ubiquinone biosynthesis UbiH/UbiF/VisC/COQ6 family hydroxylase